jgi:glycosyltransferase involved in cell wall biosynthesis
MKEIAESAAIMADPHAMDSMRDGMLRLIDSESLREELRQKGFDRAGRYSWETTARLTLEGYRSVQR